MNLDFGAMLCFHDPYFVWCGDSWTFYQPPFGSLEIKTCFFIENARLTLFFLLCKLGFMLQWVRWPIRVGIQFPHIALSPKIENKKLVSHKRFEFFWRVVSPKLLLKLSCNKSELCLLLIAKELHKILLIKIFPTTSKAHPQFFRNF
jgi:hypothetical protein